LISPSELPFQLNKTSFPLPVHAVNASEHAKISSALTNFEQMLNILHCGASQIAFTKNSYNTFCKQFHGFECSCFSSLTSSSRDQHLLTQFFSLDAACSDATPDGFGVHLALGGGGGDEVLKLCVSSTK
jgi:hypothetical protein